MKLVKSAEKQRTRDLMATVGAFMFLAGSFIGMYTNGGTGNNAAFAFNMNLGMIVFIIMIVSALLLFIPKALEK